MRRGFWDSLPLEEQVSIRTSAAEVTRALHSWAALYEGAFQPSRIGPLALTVVSAAPWLTPAQLSAAGRVSLWICAVDDLIDQGTEDLDHLAAVVERYGRVAAGDRTPDSSLLESALSMIRAELAESPLGGTLLPLWTDTLVRMLDGMRFEWEAARRLSQHGHAPDLAAYLEHGLYSIGCPTQVLTFWLLDPQPELPDQLEVLLPALRESAIAMRLANDLRTYEKERVEGSLNALMLGASRTELLVGLRAYANRSFRRLWELDPGLRSARMLERLTRFITTDFYDVTNYQ